ncbi:FliM/FliN family flagellar motor switch protein [Aliiroseovarius sp. Z3]|uniref:FliM/FliN family flagellar motor switch protein n=1 Tax=Aliiroseovarius sp. Z3 TaxID=2811402 RepID=UPI0023B2F757|nr:flagellar motor switch protein FliM [Aliiroseovarius sp. Z3]MDE9450466.1 FliM/FliN family flagellar motor switch protein [Aliiroseovarius sp. Z3]
MADPDQISAIRQKAGARRPPPEIPPVTAAGALGKALARAGVATAGLTINATDVTEDRVVLSGLGGTAMDSDLLAIAEGADSRFGLLIADPNLVAAVIEIQTVGRVLPTPAHPRPATRTDAAMCADFFDHVLEGLEDALTAAQLPVAALCNGFRFAVQMDDMRAAKMALPDIAYRRFHAALDLGDGGKQGHLTLLLPFDAATPSKSPETIADQDNASEIPPILLDAHVELHAVLHRTRMSLDDVTGWTSGMTVILPRDVLGAVVLEDLSGHARATCRLGQAGGQRAVRIGSDRSGQTEDLPAPPITSQPEQVAVPPASLPKDEVKTGAVSTAAESPA